MQPNSPEQFLIETLKEENKPIFGEKYEFEHRDMPIKIPLWHPRTIRIPTQETNLIDFPPQVGCFRSRL